MKLTIGTAQFANKYGISNKIGKPSKKVITKILRLAKKNKIKTIDTAQSYTGCEKRIGKINISKNFNFNTKIKNYSNIENSIKISLKDLKSKKINILYIHNCNILKKKRLGNFIIKNLEKIKKKKLIKKIGISIYNMKEFIYLYKNYNFDAIQIPISILNQSFDNALFKKIVNKKKIIVEARSVFMQGLIFMKDQEINKKFKKLKKKIKILNKISNNEKIIKISICLEYVKNISFIKSIIVGSNSVEEFKEILKSYYKKKLTKKINYKIFRSNSKFININQW